MRVVAVVRVVAAVAVAAAVAVVAVVRVVAVVHANLMTLLLKSRFLRDLSPIMLP